MNSIGILHYKGRYLQLECDPELGRLYRKLFQYEVYFTRKLSRPLCNVHITIIRKENVEQHLLWGKYEGELITFEYSSPVDNNGYYYWLKAYSPRFDEIRKELGLTKPPLVPYHVTFGHNQDCDMEKIIYNKIWDEVLIYLSTPHTHTEITKHVLPLGIHIKYHNIWYDVWKDLVDQNMVKYNIVNNVIMVERV